MISRIGLSCFLLLVITQVARAETLAELKREEGIDFGPCELAPRPNMRGTVVHAVIPARFEVPGIWATHSLRRALRNAEPRSAKASLKAPAGSAPPAAHDGSPSVR